MAVILTIMAAFNIIPDTVPWGMGRELSMYFVYYLFGNIMAECQWIEEIKKKGLKYEAIGACFLIGINFFLSGYRWKESIRGMSYVVAFIGIGGWICMSILLERYGGALEQLGKASLCILCLHVPVCEILTKIMVRITNMTFETAKSEMRYIFIRCVLTIAICMVCHYMILRVAPWMLGKRENS